MTVEELIKELLKYPKDSIVEIDASYYGGEVTDVNWTISTGGEIRPVITDFKDD